MKRLLMLGAVLLGVIILSLTYENRKMEEIQQGIAEKIVRFHVRANSNSKEDQELKLKVKDAVCQYMGSLLCESKSIDETKDIINRNMDRIVEIAKEVIYTNGKQYEVNAYFENSYFPLKTYGDLTFPPGEYEAFRIDIGKANGENWWCVMYPPLCFVDATYGVVPESSKEMLENILTSVEYDALSIRDGDYKEVEYTYKIKEWLCK